jgi:hypothetical protein
MTPAEALYADLRSRGIDLETDGERLRWRPAALVSPGDACRIRDARPGLIAVLRAGTVPVGCPRCGWPLDSAGRCPKCFDRVCGQCRRMTGSYFIRLCIPCGHRDDAEVSSPAADQAGGG